MSYRVEYLSTLYDANTDYEFRVTVHAQIDPADPECGYSGGVYLESVRSDDGAEHIDTLMPFARTRLESEAMTAYADARFEGLDMGEPNPPHVHGGQSRSPSDLTAEAGVIAICVVIAANVVLGALLLGWAL